MIISLGCGGKKGFEEEAPRRISTCGPVEVSAGGGGGGFGRAIRVAKLRRREKGLG